LSFHSILFGPSDCDETDARREAPDFFTDLRLDKVVATVTAGREAYDLAPFYNAPLKYVDSIIYPHEVFRDLDGAPLLDAVRSFAERMRTMREHLARADKVHYRYEKARWFLDAVGAYCHAVAGLAQGLAEAALQSRGFLALRDWLDAYVASGGFPELAADTRKVRTDLDGITYRLQIAGPRVKVSRSGSEPDYGADVVRTFERFKQGAAKKYPFDRTSWADMNHVEAAVLDLVARLHPDIFGSLDLYTDRHRAYLDATIGRFDREVQFYVAYLEHIERLRTAGLAFCHPDVTDRSKEIEGRAVFDLALADMLVREKTPIVTNDFHLTEPERILVVSGPNQGGKTTFARMIGQLHHLASIGCPVPGTKARLFLADRIFTHFEREEDLQSLSGKLEADLRRIHWILGQATESSLLVMNESFGSTTLHDALFLNKAVMEQVIGCDLICVAVTFLDELASLGPTTVSMVSTVDPEDPVRRTFKIIRRPADGLAYAAAIARKYRLTYRIVKERIVP
jgi:DNA mismatch repair protein MutS